MSTQASRSFAASTGSLLPVPETQSATHRQAQRNAFRRDARQQRSLTGPLEYSSPPLFSSGGLFRNCVIRERLIIDNRLDYLADVRAQQPIDRDAHELRRIQNRASLHDRMNSLFLVRSKPDVYDF